MTTVSISNVNPVALVAVVSATGSNTVTIKYNLPPLTSTDDIVDSFTTIPATVTVNITSTSVPSGYHLAVTGDGTWTASSASAVSGVFAGTSGTGVSYDFTVLVTNGVTVLAQHDPRLTLRKISTE